MRAIVSACIGLLVVGVMAQSDWKAYSLKELGMRASFPSAPKLQVRKASSGLTNSYSCFTNSTFFAVLCTEAVKDVDLKSTSPETQRNLLEFALNYAVGSRKDAKLVSKSAKEANGSAIVDAEMTYTASGLTGTILWRGMIVNGRLYQFMVGDLDRSEAQVKMGKFLNGVRF